MQYFTGITSYFSKNGTFGECVNLKRIHFPDNPLHKIAWASCYKCSSLTSVVIDEGITTIEGNVFESCISLTEVKLPKSLITLNGFGLSGIKSIIIPPNVTYISHGAFGNCFSLNTVILEPGTPPELGSAWNFNNNTIFYVPDESIETYKNTAIWSNYANRIKPISEFQE